MFVSQHRNRHKDLTQNAGGFTLMEAATVVAVMGVLAAIGAPLLFGVNKPLQNATGQMDGLFRQVRMRAISTTTAYRIRPISPTQVVVEAATSRDCEASTQLAAVANATDTQITVASTRGFAVGDQITVGTAVNQNITAINEGTQTITLGAPIGSAQPVDALVEPSNNWRQGALTTGITDEDLALPAARNSQERIQIAGNPSNWNLCFNSRGLASLFNLRTGRPINGGLTLSIFRADSSGNQVSGTPTGQVTVFQGGGVESNARTLNE